jgi:NAD(P)-dependent dehydrogenase (short-subunit alcohol dehydrogenase family)
MTSTVVVTGGNSGIGFWCARAIAATGGAIRRYASSPA